jgi:hypothetical protein
MPSDSRPRNLTFRQATAQEWATTDAPPLPGELVLETDTGKAKLGVETTTSYQTAPFFGVGVYEEGNNLRFSAGENSNSPYWRATLGGTVPAKDKILTVTPGYAPDPTLITITGAIVLADSEEITISSADSSGITGLDGDWYVKATENENEYELFLDKDLTTRPELNNEETYITNASQVTVNDYNSGAIAVDYDSNGNLFVAGTTEIGYIQPTIAPFVAKYTSTGSLLWQKTFQNVFVNIYAYGMAADSDGNVVLVAQTDFASDIVVAKISGEDGSVMWQRYFIAGPDADDDLNVYTLDIGSDNNPVFVGYFDQDTGAGDSNEFMIVKLSGSDGSVLWQKYLGDNSDDDINQRGYGMAIGPDDSVVITGYAYDIDTDTDFMTVAKLTSGGGLVWQKRISNPNPDWNMSGADVTVGPNGDVYCVGNYIDDVDESFRALITVFKLNSSGSMQWSRRVGPNTANNGCEDIGIGLATDAAGKLYLCARTIIRANDGGTLSQFVLACYQPDGTVVWQKYLGNPLRAEADVEIQSGGQYIAVLGDKLAICGSQKYADMYGNTGDFPGDNNNGALLIQVPTDGSVKNVAGTLFRDSSFAGVPNLGLTSSNSAFTLYNGTIITVDEGEVVASTNGDMFSLVMSAPPTVEHVFEMTPQGEFKAPSLTLVGDGFVDQLLGEEVHFVKTNFGEEVDPISDDVIIGRHPYYGGILNTVYDDYENGYQGGGNGEPSGTEWNAEGWEKLYTTPYRTYLNWVDAVNSGGNTVTDMELIMRDTYTNKYYTVKFHTFQGGGMGGGFSYTRREINLEAYFYRPDSSDNSVVPIVDEIAPNLMIARGNGGGLYNYALETNWNDDYSPLNTLWNAEGWSDLSNLTERSFLPFYHVFEQQIGKQIEQKELIMWDTNNNKYYGIKFLFWQKSSNQGGPDYPGFAYSRREIDISRLHKGITFADGTVQTTAYNEKSAGILPQITHEFDTDRWFTMGDIGKHILVTQSGASLIIPDYASVGFPIGSTITIINKSGGDIFISCDNDDESNTIYGSGTSDNASSWYVPDSGGGNVATLIKINQYALEGGERINEWILSGAGIGVD